MDDVVAVRVRQRFGHFSRDEQRVIDRQLRLSLQPVAEGFAFDERHDVVERARSIAGVVDGKDVGVLQPCGQLDLAERSRPSAMAISGRSVLSATKRSCRTSRAR